MNKMAKLRGCGSGDNVVVDDDDDNNERVEGRQEKKEGKTKMTRQTVENEKIKFAVG